jgi:hypothetical protein
MNSVRRGKASDLGHNRSGYYLGDDKATGCSGHEENDKFGGARLTQRDGARAVRSQEEQERSEMVK